MFNFLFMKSISNNSLKKNTKEKFTIFFEKYFKGNPLDFLCGLSFRILSFLERRKKSQIFYSQKNQNWFSKTA